MLAVIGVVLMIAITVSFLKPFTRLAWKRGASARGIILALYGGMVTFVAGSPSPRKLCWRSDRAQVRLPSSPSSSRAMARTATRRPFDGARQHANRRRT